FRRFLAWNVCGCGYGCWEPPARWRTHGRCRRNGSGRAGPSTRCQPAWDSAIRRRRRPDVQLECTAQRPELTGRLLQQFLSAGVGLGPAVDDDSPLGSAERMAAGQLAVGDEREVVVQLLLEHEQQVVRAVPHRRLCDM